MSLPTVADLNTSVAAILTGIDLDSVPDLYGSYERAVSTTIQKAPVLEASGREPIMLYDGVETYAAPETIFGGALIDIRPQGIERNYWDDVVKMPILRFDLSKQYTTPSGYRATFESRKKQILMRIAQNFATKRVTLDAMTDTDGWALAGNASGLAEDSTVFYHQPGSLRFNLTAAGAQATMTKTLTDALDLSDYEGVGVAFLAIYMPNQAGVAPITSLVARIGSSALNYYEVTETEGFLGAFYKNDFLLVAFDLAGAAATGSPNFSAVNYLEVILNFNGTAVPNVRLGDFFMALPSNHEVLFYSPAVFVHDDGDASAEITDETDEILFHPASYNIYVQEAARDVAKNVGGEIASGLIASIDLVLNGRPGDKDHPGLYTTFRGDNPSEELRQVGSYYDSSFPGNGGGRD
jgi:hypothetical protein